MNNEKLLTSILDKELTPESKIKLNKLSELVKNKQSNGPFLPLQEAIAENEITRFIFEYAGRNQKKGIDALLKGYLSPDEVCEKLHISRRTLQAWRTLGILEGRKYRNTYYYSISKFESILMKNYKSIKSKQNESSGL